MSSRNIEIERLKRTLQQTLSLFDGPEDALSRAYAPGKWSVRQVLVHLSDAEAVHLDRLRRIAAEDNPSLEAFDQDLWASHLFYEKRDIKLARMQFESARRSVIELAERLESEADTKVGTHSEVGRVTFANVIEKVSNHNEHHLDQVRAAIENRTWNPR